MQGVMKGCDGSDLATIRYYRQEFTTAPTAVVYRVYVSNQKRTVRDEPVCWWVVQQLDFFGVDSPAFGVVDSRSWLRWWSRSWSCGGGWGARRHSRAGCFELVALATPLRGNPVIRLSFQNAVDGKSKSCGGLMDGSTAKSG